MKLDRTVLQSMVHRYADAATDMTADIDCTKATDFVDGGLKGSKAAEFAKTGGKRVDEAFAAQGKSVQKLSDTAQLCLDNYNRTEEENKQLYIDLGY